MVRKIHDPLPVELVGRADPQLGQLAEYVQKHDRQAVDAAEPRGVAGGDDVEPAATPRPPRDGAVFIAPVANVLADRVVLLGGKRTASHPRAIRLDDAQDLCHVAAGHTGSTGYAHSGAVAAGDERECAVIDVQQGPLGPFKEDLLAALDGVQQIGGCVAHVGTQPLRITAVLLEDLLRIQTETVLRAAEAG